MTEATEKEDGQGQYSEWLQELLDRLEITSYSLAKRSGVPQPTVTRILTGETQNPKVETLRALSAVAGEDRPPKKIRSEDLRFRLEIATRLTEAGHGSVKETAHQVNQAIAVLKQSEGGE